MDALRAAIGGLLALAVVRVVVYVAFDTEGRLLQYLGRSLLPPWRFVHRYWLCPQCLGSGYCQEGSSAQVNALCPVCQPHGFARHTPIGYVPFDHLVRAWDWAQWGPRSQASTPSERCPTTRHTPALPSISWAFRSGAGWAGWQRLHCWAHVRVSAAAARRGVRRTHAALTRMADTCRHGGAGSRSRRTR